MIAIIEADADDLADAAQRRAKREAPSATLVSTFAGTALIAAMSAKVGARGLSAAKLPERSKTSPSRKQAGLLAG